MPPLIPHIVRWYIYAVFGGLAGALAFVVLLHSGAGSIILLATGSIAAAVEIVLAQRRPRTDARPRLRAAVSAVCAGALAIGLSFAVYLVLYATTVAP